MTDKYIYFNKQWLNIRYIVRFWMCTKENHGRNSVMIELPDDCFGVDYDHKEDAELHYERLMKDLGVKDEEVN